jgi:hypothetical protein
MSSEKLVCGKWSAIHDFMPPLPARLDVSGECTTPTPGYTIVLEKTRSGINPNILILKKIVTGPSGVVPQQIVTTKVSYHEETNEPFTDVTIVPDNITIKVEDVH